jgi:tetratricopeptide (TPR) repeat protein
MISIHWKRRMTDEEAGADFDEALRLMHAGQHQESIRMFIRLLDQGSLVERRLRAGANTMIGFIKWDRLHDTEGALPYFMEGVALAPRHEKASLGLFHMLLELGRVDDAFDEMRRFLKLRPSEMYSEYLRDINSIEEPD